MRPKKQLLKDIPRHRIIPGLKLERDMDGLLAYILRTQVNNRGLFYIVVRYNGYDGEYVYLINEIDFLVEVPSYCITRLKCLAKK